MSNGERITVGFIATTFASHAAKSADLPDLVMLFVLSLLGVWLMISAAFRTWRDAK